MADYTIINSTGSALASGGVTTAAHTIETGVTLSDANLAIVAALNGVAVMQDAPTAAEKLAVGNELLGGGAGDAPGVSYDVFNGTGSELTNINAAGDDVPAYATLESTTLTASELAGVVDAGVLVGLEAATAAAKEANRKAAKVVTVGELSSARN